MRLVYESTGAEVKVGDMVKLTRGDFTEEVRVDFFREPHKPASSGKVVVMEPDGGTSEYYVGVIGAEWIEREDRAAIDAASPPFEDAPKMRNGKPLKTLPDGAPRRMADGKNAWRKMNDAQRLEFIEWVLDGKDAPALDGPTWDAIERATNSDAALGAALIGAK